MPRAQSIPFVPDPAAEFDVAAFREQLGEAEAFVKVFRVTDSGRVYCAPKIPLRNFEFDVVERLHGGGSFFVQVIDGSTGRILPGGSGFEIDGPPKIKRNVFSAPAQQPQWSGFTEPEATADPTVARLLAKIESMEARLSGGAEVSQRGVVTSADMLAFARELRPAEQAGLTLEKILGYLPALLTVWDKIKPKSNFDEGIGAFLKMKELMGGGGAAEGGADRQALIEMGKEFMQSPMAHALGHRLMGDKVGGGAASNATKKTVETSKALPSVSSSPPLPPSSASPLSASSETSSLPAAAVDAGPEQQAPSSTTEQTTGATAESAPVLDFTMEEELGLTLLAAGLLKTARAEAFPDPQPAAHEIVEQIGLKNITPMLFKCEPGQLSAVLVRINAELMPHVGFVCMTEGALRQLVIELETENDADAGNDVEDELAAAPAVAETTPVAREPVGVEGTTVVPSTPAEAGSNGTHRKGGAGRGRKAAA